MAEFFNKQAEKGAVQTAWASVYVKGGTVLVVVSLFLVFVAPTNLATKLTGSIKRFWGGDSAFPGDYFFRALSTGSLLSGSWTSRPVSAAL